MKTRALAVVLVVSFGCAKVSVEATPAAAALAAPTHAAAAPTAPLTMGDDELAARTITFYKKLVEILNAEGSHCDKIAKDLAPFRREMEQLDADGDALLTDPVRNKAFDDKYAKTISDVLRPIQPTKGLFHQ